MPDVCTSDHKPVRASFDLKVNRSGFHDDSFDAFGIQLEISAIECRGLPAMDADGKSDPFVEFRVVSSVGITSDEVHTDVQNDQLNPNWKDQVLDLRLPLDSRNHFKSLSLVAQVLDQDLMTSQLIGSFCMSLEDLVKKDYAHVHLEPLEKYGRKFKRGRLSFSIHVKGDDQLLRLRNYQSTKIVKGSDENLHRLRNFQSTKRL
jgi:hypothetical protein